MNINLYRLLLLSLFPLLTVTMAHAQKQIVSQHHAWLMYFGNHRISDHWGLHTEYQWRRSDFFADWQQSLLRFGLDYYPTGDNSQILTAGYAWIVSYPYGEFPIAETFAEHRIWETWTINHRIGRLYANHRYRLEQRFLEQPSAGKSVFRQRIRYRFMLTYPIGRKDLSNRTFFAAAYAEPFLGFGKGIGKNILDQNRLYAALGYRVNPNVNMQLGYLNQYVIKPDGIQQERNHTLQVALTYNIDFRKVNE